MVDPLSPAARSALMSRIRGKDTKPEMVVRRLAHRMGYRFRLHRRDLPGTPDLVFVSRRKVIFVHGCFWHRHPSAECLLARIPKSRQEFWLPKLTANRARDLASEDRLRACHWGVLTIWECELRNIHEVAARLRDFLGPRGGTCADIG